MIYSQYEMFLKLKIDAKQFSNMRQKRIIKIHDFFHITKRYKLKLTNDESIIKRQQNKKIYFNRQYKVNQK